MFSTIATTPTTRIGAFSWLSGAHGRDHRGAAGHVVLHPVHQLGRLDRDAAGVEGHALADQAEDRAGRHALGVCASVRRRGGSMLPCATPITGPCRAP
jgi:hypothetical protein